MTPRDALEQTKKDFRYVADEGKDRWRLGPFEGQFEGDCEEFALTLLLRHAGSEAVMFDMLRTGEARIERVLSERGNGHAVLWIERWGYVDSIHQFWREKRLFEHVQTFSARDVERKLEGKKVRGPINKKMLVLALLAGAGTLFFVFGGFQ